MPFDWWAGLLGRLGFALIVWWVADRVRGRRWHVAHGCRTAGSRDCAGRPRLRRFRLRRAL